VWGGAGYCKQLNDGVGRRIGAWDMYQLKGVQGKSEWLPLPITEVAVVDGWGDVAEPIEPWDATGASGPLYIYIIYTSIKYTSIQMYKYI